MVEDERGGYCCDRRKEQKKSTTLEFGVKTEVNGIHHQQAMYVLSLNLVDLTFGV